MPGWETSDYGEQALDESAVLDWMTPWKTSFPTKEVLRPLGLVPQSGEPTSAFCTLSLLWVPSQYGGFWVALQVQRATVRVSSALNLSGDRPVRWKKWEPSQKGCFLLRPHTHHL